MKTISYLVLFLSCTISNAQDFRDYNDLDTNKLSSELKAMAIGGGATFVATTGLGFVLANALSEGNGVGESTGAILNTALSISVPGSLLSAGLGYLLGTNHSGTEGSFSIGGGWSATTVGDDKGPQDVDASAYHGFEIRIGTPRFGPITYSLSFNRYLTHKYVTFDDPAESTRWSFDCNMHYLLSQRQVQFYPFLGSNLFISNHIGTRENYGRRYNRLEIILGLNIGMGVSYQFNNRMVIYFEPKLVTSYEGARWAVSIGSHYEL